LLFIYNPSSYLLYSTRTGTMASCGIVAGAAALVLEKFPHYTPQQVKEYLVNQSTLGIVQTSLDAELGSNRFLYIRETGGCYYVHTTCNKCMHNRNGWMDVCVNVNNTTVT